MPRSISVADGQGAVELVLSTAAPLSIDVLVAWDAARPSVLWRVLERGTAEGWLARVEAGGQELFVYRDADRRRGVLAGATIEEWRWLLGLEALVPAALEGARVAARERQFGIASHLYAALVRLAPREAIPGGARGWLEVVGECVRVFRVAGWLEPEVLDEALEMAFAHGDLRLQAVLAGARGFVACRLLRQDEADALFERALEAAGALQDGAVGFEVHAQIAYGRLLEGRPRDAIAILERFLGDAPEDFVPLPWTTAPPTSSVPESPLAVLAALYGQTGQYARAFEMLNRFQLAGEQLERPELIAQAQTFIGGLQAGRRDLEAARTNAESAFAHWRVDGGDPYSLWHSAMALAWVRSAEERFEEARDVLEEGQRARVASGIMYFVGSHLFEVLERIEDAGLGAPNGLGLDAEIDRMLAWPDAYMSGVAHRYRARRLARGPLDDAAASQIDRLHANGILILRKGMPSPVELARSLDEAARWAERRGRLDESRRLADEARELFASIGLAPQPDLVAPSRIAAALVEIGRLGALAHRADGAWGEIASRLCTTLGSERCALVEIDGAKPRTLAARGGSAGWMAAVHRIAEGRQRETSEAMAPPAIGERSAAAAQLLVVPFSSERLGRRGYAFLENRHGRPLVGPSDVPILDVLQAQLGVVLENVAMWQELSAVRQRLEHENRYYRDIRPAAASGQLVADSPALGAVLGLIARVAPSGSAVLLSGETGVGKELLAQEIHRLSPRKDGPFIAVHIASLPAGLVASALFGHERGAFTSATEQRRGRFELADGGTLFLDEIGELGLEDQVRLLRVLQEGAFERLGGTRQLRSDFRLVTATNRDLLAEVKAGRFRQDLYFRLAAFPIHVPPLRERREEIPPLALRFMQSEASARGVVFEGIGQADMERLVAYPWPGNVRELKHVIGRAALLSDPPRLRIPPLNAPSLGATTAPATDWVPLEEAERRYVRQVILHTRGRITGKGGAAEILGVNPSTLNWRIGKLGLRAELKRARSAAS